MSVYDSVYGSYYQYQTFDAVHKALSLLNLFFGFFIAVVVVLVFMSMFNRNS